ncbi:MAG TPA: hydrogen gas-evolving membrane-bound hydrogenase subunit E [Bdellovibrionota bacterium]|nr:hydrogen gas-evolving membrane-bound hydrogenase subunit E [Bdellovibrionota bacterium]
MLSAILACCLGAMLAPLIKKFVGQYYYLALSLIPFALFLLVLEQSTWLAQTQGSSFALTETYSWFPKWKANLDFRGDGLSFLLAGLVTGIGTFISIYAGAYLKKHAHDARFYVYLFIFMAAMLGIAFSDNFYLFFTFWELVGIASFFLIGFDFSDKRARRNATQALLVTSLGGLCLLAACVLMHHALGAATFSNLAQHAADLQSHALFPWILGLVFVAAFTKSALFPFHFWLPNAMSAPTPASAYLHSATMVKAGIFLLARVAPAFDSVPIWSHVLLAVGSLTVIVAAVRAFFQVDLKLLLAYSTLAALGILALGLGIGTPLAIKSALVFMVAHGFYKAALFLVVGIVDHQTGTRDVRKLGGLGPLLPFTSVALILAAIAIVGLPPALSYIGKETLLAGVLSHKWGALWASVVGLGIMAFVFVGMHLVYIFFMNKEAPHTSTELREAPWTMWIGPLVLGFFGLCLPFFSGWFDASIVNPAYDTFLKPGFEYHLSFWHGFSWPLLVTVLSLGLGYLAFIYGRASLSDLVKADAEIKFGTVQIYDFFCRALNLYAGPFFRLFQNGYLRFYLHAILWVFVAAAIGYFATHPGAIPPTKWAQKTTVAITIVQTLIALGAVLCVLARRIFTSVLALGLVGFGIALVYVMHGAPDLALTQFLIETLTLVLLVLILRAMPASANFVPRLGQALNLALALSFGTVFAFITYVAGSGEVPESVSKFYATTALSEAHGRNVVNAILVDYRGFDTLGEIVVLALAGIGVYTLVRPKLWGAKK